MIFEKIFKKISITFLICLFFLLVYSLDYNIGTELKYLYPNTYFRISAGAGGYDPFLWNENGIIENVQTIFLLINLFVLIKLAIYRQTRNNILIVMILYLIGIFYIFGEEISWGQHFLKFDTPNIFLEKDNIFYNKQAEMNIHNISNLFNEIPKFLVLFWCSFSILLLRFLKYSVPNYIKFIIEPNKNLIYLSYFIILISIPELIITKLNLYNSSNLIIYKDNLFYNFNSYQLSLSILSFNFIRFSELQELALYYYFLCHSIFLNNLLINKVKIK